MNPSLTPPTRFVVPIKTWNATSRGMDAAATDMATTKFIRIPTFCTVRSTPETLPYDPGLAFAITALLFDGKNIAGPNPDTPDASRMTQRGESTWMVR
ncbi:MAG: hypothetical protein ABFC38_06395 [Methanospirillum sp.]